MERMKSNICMPKGFSAAGTYSGICNDRVRLDLAMIMSRIDCSIVTVQADGTGTSGMARTLLYHNGLAMPQGKRGQEITEEVAQAVGGQMKLAADHVAVVTTGASGKYFRPSLMINSVPALAASLSPYHGDQVEAVADNGSGLESQAVTFSAGSGKCTLGGVLTEDTQDAPGVCLMTTDMAASPEQLKQAVGQIQGQFALQDMVVIVMANGMVPSTGCDVPEVLAQAMGYLLGEMGFHPAMKECS
jgi:glutamate N-acetyltransferase/amino-acid N-acetyltransferase